MRGSAEGRSSEDLIHSDMTEALNSIAPVLHSSIRILQQSVGIKWIMVPVNLGLEKDTSENEGEQTAICMTMIIAPAQDTTVGHPASTNIQAGNGQKSACRQPMDFWRIFHFQKSMEVFISLSVPFMEIIVLCL